MTASRLGLRKEIFFGIIVLCIPFLFLELLVRFYAATQVGPRVLLYGTTFSRHQEQFDPIGAEMRKAQEESTVRFHENARGTYSKYYPNQKLIDRDEFGNKIDVRINSRGFRGKDFEITKEPDVIRIITLGASSTFGFKEHDDKTYPRYMEQLLNEALPTLGAKWHGKSIKRFEVINLGVPHLRTEEILSLFVNEGLEINADFVTFYEGINDAARTEPPATWTEESKQAIKAIPFANHVFRQARSRLLSVAFIGMLITQYRTDYSDREVQVHRLGKKEHFIANLQRIQEACKQKNIKFIIANQQATNMEETREKLRGLTYEQEQAIVRKKLSETGRLNGRDVAFLMHKELMDAEREWAIAANIPYVDVIDAMDLSRQNLVSWVHLNAAGNRIVASAIAKEILKQVAGSEFQATQKP